MISNTTEINIQKVAQSKINQVDWNNLPFGKVFTDHMLVMDYKNGQWQTPEIKPFGPIQMHPAMSAIHYGQTIFEGMKAYKRENGEVILFRPEMNAARFIESCERLCMPAIEENVFVDLVRKLVELDREWVPKTEGHTLYIRPFMFATEEAVGIRPSDSYRFIVFLCPVGSYYSKPLRIRVEEYYTRAAIGGVGRAKTAGNYASSLYPQKLGKEAGYDQLLWTDAKEHKFIEESGTMNICFVINNTLISPSEEEDTILRGTTKRTILDIATKWGMHVEERKISVEEVITAAKNGVLQEAFGAGTAATIASIEVIAHEGTDYTLPTPTEDFFSQKAKKYLDDLKGGRVADEENWCVQF